MKQSKRLYPKASLSQKTTSTNFFKFFFLLCIPMLGLLTAGAQTQVTVTSSTGTGAAGINYATIGSAFNAINTGGIHTGAVTITVNSNTTETASAILNGSGAGGASYSSILIQPSADAVTISANFTTAGRGIIELNGADDVTINGDNPNTAGTNKNLTITFSTAQAVSQSLVRLVTSTLPLDCNNVAIKNCFLKGNVLNGNSPSIVSSTSSAALSMAVVAAGGGSTTSNTAAPSALATTGVTSIAAMGSSADNFVLDNCTINNVGVGLHFFGPGTPAGCNLMTVTNNTIGTAGSLSTFPGGPASTVYFKGIFYKGIKAATITGNTIQGICGYFISGSSPNIISAIECNSGFTNGGGTFNFSNNTITGIWSNNAATAGTTTQIARAIAMTGSAAGTTINVNKNTISSVKSNTVSNTTNLAAIAVDLGINATGSSIVVSNNSISDVYASKAWGVAGISLSTGGNNGNIYNNTIYNVSAAAGGTGVNTIIAGIRVAIGNNHKVYHNSVLMNSSYGNFQHLSACFAGLVSTANANIDVRNNIFANYNTTSVNMTSADAAVILNSALTSSSNYTLNNNAYYGPIAAITNYAAYLYNTTSFANPGSSNSFKLANFVAASTSPSTNFRSFSSTLNAAGTNDNASSTATLSNPSPFAAATNLHISSAVANNTNGTRLESKGATGLVVSGAGLSTDFEGDTRNGPSGSANGGATAPDLGADEFDGKPFLGDCTGTPAAGTVTGNGLDLYCTTSAPAARTFTLSGNTSNAESIVIQWESSVTSSITGFIAINGENSPTYTTSAAPTQTTWYRAAVICTKSGVTSYQASPAITELTSEKKWIGGNGDWNNAANWICGVPTTDDAVVIDNGNPHLDVNFAVNKSLTISGTGQLTVNPTSTLSVTASGTADFGGKAVTFRSTAAGTASLGKIDGNLINASNVTVERFIPQNTNRAWRLLSSPTEGQTIKEAWQENQSGGTDGVTGYGTNITSGASTWASDGFDFKTSSSSILAYNPSTNTLNGLTNTNAAIADEPGYFLYIRGGRNITPSSSVVAGSATTLRTTGTLYTGTQPDINVGADKFALIGNPYASALDVRNIALAGGSVGTSFYVWDPKLLGSYNLGAYQTLVEAGGNYIVVPGGGSYGSSGSINNTIESGAAFLVQAVGAPGTVTISEESKAAGSRMVFRPNGNAITESLGVTLLAKNNGVFTVADGTIAFFDNAYDDGIDGFDNKKINNFSENFSILKKGSNLVVEKRQPVTTADTMFFKAIYLKKIDYRLAIAATNLDHGGMTGFLEDSYTSAKTALNLNDSTIYDFTVDNNAASSSSSRFKIVFKPAIVLPVTFTDVKAVLQDKKTVLNWEVGSQINVKSYSIERSLNGHDFTTMGEAVAATQAVEKASYSWIDGTPATGVNYYRIKSIDVNGAFKYSNVVKVTLSKLTPAISISPNPVQGNIATVKLDLVKGSYSISVSSLAGKLVYKTNQYHNGNLQSYNIQLPKSVASGVYQVTVTGSDNQPFTQKLVINNK